MCIQGRVLYHNLLWYPDSERSKVPYRFDSSIHHFISNFLCHADRYGKHSDSHIVLPHDSLKIIRMVDRNTIDFFADQIRIDIKSSYDFQPELAQTRIAQQSAPQASHSKQERFMHTGKSQEIFQHLNECINLIPHPRPTGNFTYDKSFATCDASMFVCFEI